MKVKTVFIVVGLLGIIAVSCRENTPVDAEASDQEKGVWNGEYLKIEEADSVKKATKKSYGSEVLNLGKVNYTLGGEENAITQFPKNKNDITLFRDKIVIRIGGTEGESFFMTFLKANIYKAAEGEYNLLSTQKTKEKQVFTMSYVAPQQANPCMLKEGKALIREFNPRLGRIVLSVSGNCMRSKDLMDQFSEEIILQVNMNFETVVSSFNPEESDK
ncbi:MAG: hypothetical protein R3277_10805 [Brumimicrobium sp.]|nr:hypothetical protein [Brumimicrobium sp.]